MCARTDGLGQEKGNVMNWTTEYNTREAVALLGISMRMLDHNWAEWVGTGST